MVQILSLDKERASVKAQAVDSLKNIGFDTTAMQSPSEQSIPMAVGPADVEDPYPMAVGSAQNYEHRSDESGGRPSSVASDSTWASRFPWHSSDDGSTLPQDSCAESTLEPQPVPKQDAEVVADLKASPIGPPVILTPPEPTKAIASSVSPKQDPVQSPKFGLKRSDFPKPAVA